jgi:hypothetical protein
MTAEGSPNTASPTAEATGWVGFEVDDVGGSRVGRVAGVFVDAENGGPAWLIVTLGRRRLLSSRRAETAVAIPVRDCAGAGGRVWTALGREALLSAPSVDPHRPLLRKHEATICAHYGIGAGVGRHAEVVRRPEGVVTSHPAAG